MDQNLKKTIKDIKDIKIQGATNVAKQSLMALKKYSQKSRLRSSAKFISTVTTAGKALSEARDTEPLARNAIKFVEIQMQRNKELTVKELKQVVAGSTEAFLHEIEDNTLEIAQKGQKIIKNNRKVFTHCHSSSVEHLLINAKKSGKNFEVYNTETRPLFQGRKTSEHLTKNKIKNIMVVDSAASFVVSRYSGKQLMMDVVLLGSDAISLNGGAVNKVGSFGIAQTAFYEKVPIYIVTNLLKIDIDAKTAKEIDIELRSGKEIWNQAPKSLKMINFAFDLVPARFIKGFITQVGIIKPHKILKSVKKHYSWLLK